VATPKLNLNSNLRNASASGSDGSHLTRVDASGNGGGDGGDSGDNSSRNSGGDRQRSVSREQRVGQRSGVLAPNGQWCNDKARTASARPRSLADGARARSPSPADGQALATPTWTRVESDEFEDSHDTPPLTAASAATKRQHPMSAEGGHPQKEPSVAFPVGLLPQSPSPEHDWASLYWFEKMVAKCQRYGILPDPKARESKVEKWWEHLADTADDEGGGERGRIGEGLRPTRLPTAVRHMVESHTHGNVRHSAQGELNPKVEEMVEFVGVACQQDWEGFDVSPHMLSERVSSRSCTKCMHGRSGGWSGKPGVGCACCVCTSASSCWAQHGSLALLCAGCCAKIG
jgi:hypothetical protein